MDNFDDNELFDLGSSPVDEDFDPFALEEDEPTDGVVEEAPAPQPQEDAPAQEEPAPAATVEPVPAEPAKSEKVVKSEPNTDEKPPVFVYAGATETIGDTSMTFDELRIEKARTSRSWTMASRCPGQLSMARSPSLSPILRAPVSAR